MKGTRTRAVNEYWHCPARHKNRPNYLAFHLCSMPASGAADSARKKTPRTGAQARPVAKHTRSLPRLTWGKGARKSVPHLGDGSAARGWDGRSAHNPLPSISNSMRAEQLFSSGWLAAEQEQTRRAMHGWLQTVR